MFRKRDHGSVSQVRSGTGRGAKSNYSMDTSGSKLGVHQVKVGSMRASSALSQPSHLALHEVLDPRSKRFSTVKKPQYQQLHSETPTDDLKVTQDVFSTKTEVKR